MSDLEHLADDDLLERIKNLRIFIAFATSRPESVITLESIDHGLRRAGRMRFGPPSRRTPRDAGLDNAARAAQTLAEAEKIAAGRNLISPDTTAAIAAALDSADDGERLASRFLRARRTRR